MQVDWQILIAINEQPDDHDTSCKTHEFSPSPPITPRKMPVSTATSIDSSASAPSRKTRCAAVDRWGQKCVREKGEGDPRWCEVHRKEQTRLYKDYKRCTSELQLFELIQAGKDRRVIEMCEDVEALKEWHTNLSRRFVLLSRAIDSRSYHHEHFYAEDVDFGHAKFIQNLKRDRKLCEMNLHHIEQRAHELILASVNASFILQENEMPRPTEDLDCHGDRREDSPPSPTHTDSKKSSPRAKRNRLPDEDEIDNPLEAAYQQRRLEALKALMDYFHRNCGYDDVVVAYERKLICDAVMREVIIHDPALAFAAQPYDSVQGFISGCDELSLQDLERLQKLLLIKRCCTSSTMGKRENYIRNAAQNVLFRNPDDVPEHEKVWFLGGWVYKSPSTEDMPIRGWDHVYAFTGCGKCVLSCVRSLSELVRNRKFEVSPCAEPRFAEWLDDDDRSPYSRVLRALGMVVGESSSLIQRNVFRNWSLQTGDVWTERQDRAWLYMRVQLDEPWVEAFLQNLAASSFDSITRNGRTGEVKSWHVDHNASSRPPAVWVSRERIATSEAALVDAKWKNLVKLDDKRFATSRSPENIWGLDFSEDALEIFIMDSPANIDQSKATFNDFMWLVAFAGLQAQGYKPELWNDVFDTVGKTAENVWDDHLASVDVATLDLSWKCEGASCRPGCRIGDCINCLAIRGSRQIFMGCGHCKGGDNLHDSYLQYEHHTGCESD